MAGWEEELAMLLRGLGVTQEEPATHLPTTRLTTRKFLRGDVKRQRLSTDALFWDGAGGSVEADKSSEDGRDGRNGDDDDDDTELTDITSMRREVDSIVRQVIRLMQRGDLDESVKEDVMVVLRALRRGATIASEQAGVGEEVYLEQATAMLHLCRLVLNLSEAAIEDF
jgi:predicted transcriptional regulator